MLIRHLRETVPMWREAAEMRHQRPAPLLWECPHPGSPRHPRQLCSVNHSMCASLIYPEGRALSLVTTHLSPPHSIRKCRPDP